MNITDCSGLKGDLEEAGYTVSCCQHCHNDSLDNYTVVDGDTIYCCCSVAMAAMRHLDYEVSFGSCHGDVCDWLRGFTGAEPGATIKAGDKIYLPDGREGVAVKPEDVGLEFTKITGFNDNTTKERPFDILEDIASEQTYMQHELKGLDELVAAVNRLAAALENRNER